MSAAMPTKKNKRRRLIKSSKSTKGCDLNVPLPEVTTLSSSFKGKSSLHNRKNALLERLHQIGYDTVAFSHTAYGKLQPKDEANTAVFFPENKPNGCTLLRRVNVVIEELSDLRFYNNVYESSVQSKSSLAYPEDANSSISSLLDGYDIVALSPRNEATFSAACTSGVDLIMLDYNSSRGRLPYRLRSSDIRAATGLGIAFEICYGPAIADPAKRKFFVQAAAEFISASGGVRPKPTLVLSSGSRTTPTSVDIGPLALRSAADLTNVMKCVLGFDDRTSHDAMRDSAKVVLKHGQRRSLRLGIDSALVISLDGDTNHSLSKPSPALKDACLAATFPLLYPEKDISQPEDLEQEDQNDGFITLN